MKRWLARWGRMCGCRRNVATSLYHACTVLASQTTVMYVQHNVPRQPHSTYFTLLTMHSDL